MILRKHLLCLLCDVYKHRTLHPADEMPRPNLVRLCDRARACMCLFVPAWITK